MAKRPSAKDLADFPLPPFEGFPADAFAFFAELAAHQSKDWFEANRSRYEQGVRGPFQALVADFSAAAAETGLPFRGDPKTALFRIHRDVRFSKDKRPYKTNAGAVLRADKAAERGIFYIHLSADDNFAACGFYDPSKDLLARLRQGMVENPERWRQVTASLAHHNLAFDPSYSLTRPPRGYPSNLAPDIEDALKFKSLVVRRDLAREAMKSPGLTAELIAFAKAAQPVLTLLD